MQSVYDVLKDFAMILGDYDNDLDEENKSLHRGVVINGTDENNLKTFKDTPYILRSMVTVEPDTYRSNHGSFSMALPCIVEEKEDVLYLRVLRFGGNPEEKLKKIKDWELPEGGQEGVADGDSGVLVVGTETFEQKKIFVTSRSSLVADHRGPKHTEGSTIVRDLSENPKKEGLRSRLATAFWVSETPYKVDVDKKSVVTLNAYSSGAQFGHHTEHHGGAFSMFNTNVGSYSGEPPRVVAWSADLDDGPFYAGRGQKDQHSKGIDDEGMSHLPLMFKTTGAKFGPAPQNMPAAPIDFLDYFAAPAAYSQRIFRAEIVYDPTLQHPNGSGFKKWVDGRWVIQYRLPHRGPYDSDPYKKGGDPSTKTPIDSDPYDKTGDPYKKGDPARKAGNPPIDHNPEFGKPKVSRPQTAEEFAKGISGTGEIQGGVGYCRPDSSGTPRDSGPSQDMPDGVGGDGSAIEDGRHGAAQGKADESGSSDGSGGIGGGNDDDVGGGGPIPEPVPVEPDKHDGIGGSNLASIAKNMIPQLSLDEVLGSNAVLNSAHVDRMPLSSHMQVAYPTIKGMVLNPEFEERTRASLRDDLSEEEVIEADAQSVSSTMLAVFGNTRIGRTPLTENEVTDIVSGGFLISGADLNTEDIYDSNSNSLLDAVFGLREEASIQFGYPSTDGTIPDAFVIERDSASGEIIMRFKDDVAGLPVVLTDRVHFKSPIRITQMTTVERGTLDVLIEGVMVYDTDTNYAYISSNGVWQILGNVTTAANIDDNYIVKGDGGASGIQDSGILIEDTDNLVMPKTEGVGIKVDTAFPTFGWHDLLGEPTVRGTGSNDPNFINYADTLRQFIFATNGSGEEGIDGDEMFFNFHIPHDYVSGSDLHLHIHWSQNEKRSPSGASTNAVTGGTVTWKGELTYAQGHQQMEFPKSINVIVTATLTSNNARHHYLTEIVISGSASETLLDSDNFEPDGVVLLRLTLFKNDITVASGNKPDPFLHYADLHYQSTNISTKEKAPPFYT